MIKLYATYYKNELKGNYNRLPYNGTTGPEDGIKECILVQSKPFPLASNGIRQVLFVKFKKEYKDIYIDKDEGIYDPNKDKYIDVMDEKDFKDEIKRGNNFYGTYVKEIKRGEILKVYKGIIDGNKCVVKIKIKNKWITV